MKDKWRRYKVTEIRGLGNLNTIYGIPLYLIIMRDIKTIGQMMAGAHLLFYFETTCLIYTVSVLSLKNTVHQGKKFFAAICRIIIYYCMKHFIYA